LSEIDQALRAHFDRLLSVCAADGKPLTQQAMADQLNQANIPSLSGRPWSKYSVRRILRKLEQKATVAEAAPPTEQPQPSDDEIRARIRTGYYDTADERFIAVPVEKTVQEKSEPVKEAAKQETKKPKNKKKKDKKGKGKEKGKGKKKQ